MVVLFAVGCSSEYEVRSPDSIIANKRGENISVPVSYWLTNTLNTENIATVGGYTLGAYLFVTSLNLEDDQQDYWKTPKETLETGSGDCEDLSFLLASLLWSNDIESLIVVGTFNGEGHMWVEVDDKIYETTDFVLPFSAKDGNELGYIPKIKVGVGYDKIREHK